MTLIIACASLAACSGNSNSSGSGSFKTTRATQTYLTYDDSRGGTSTMGGAAVDIATLVASPVAGQRIHPSGIDIVTTPSGTITSATTPTTIPNTYDFVRPIDFVGTGIFQTGIFGVVTNATDVNNAANATYVGDFDGSIVFNAGADQLQNWTASIDADFAKKTLDASFTGSGSIINGIRVDDAKISGNSFSGGTLSTSFNGTNVNVVNSAVDLDGAFFGYDATKTAPDEVGGVLVSKGTGANFLRGAFIAD